MTGITLIGLGPGDPGQLTRAAWEALSAAEEVWLRTEHHPVTAHLPANWRSFDFLYEEKEHFEQVYEAIVDEVLRLGRRPQGVVYAVPGDPFIAEATGPEIARRARAEGLPLRVHNGVSFIEPVFAALGLDPYPHTALVDALTLSERHTPPFPPSRPALIAQVYSRLVASEVKLNLMAVYPDEHPVRLVHAAGTAEERVEDLPLYAIDRSPHIGLLTALYLPPLPDGTALEDFFEVVARLRAPDGCPWDRKQTHQTLRSHLLEEAYEALAALDAENPAAMREEFGDLLLQIVLHAVIAAEAGEYTLPEVIQTVHDKIIRRHPHVFGDVQAADADQVLQNWERLKQQEREANGQAEKSLLDGISRAMPALSVAQKYQDRAARVGFDWPVVDEVLDKIVEEVNEIRAAENPQETAAELGDLLFVLVNFCRWQGVDAESALREANARFYRRFSHIEACAREQGRPLDDLSLDEMEACWQEAKHLDEK